MMHLAASFIEPKRLLIFTIDHGLRPEAADEIAQVAAQASRLGINHIVAQWKWDGTGNLQAAARAGRWAALRALAAEHQVGSVWMGHTQDDQIETFMMRLARGSGVDGLTAMQASTHRDGLTIFRPMLEMTRADLRIWLTLQDIRWCDDPSNEDTRFDRVRARQMFIKLSDLGLTAKRVLQTIDHMQAARVTLRQAAYDFANQNISQVLGDLLIGSEALPLQMADAPRRIMAAAIGWVGGHTFKPRFEQLLDAVRRVQAGETTTLGGCILTPDKGGTMRLTREAAVTKPIVLSVPQDHIIWDRRWCLSGPLRNGMTVKSLGEGIQSCPDWRKSGLPRVSLLASPAVWYGTDLVAAPLAGLTNGWSAQIVADFHSMAFAIEE
ncbi:MAG: tRNA(Ile)-lysidine synthase [Yoonia sp.]|jgi:tRNA(Ile)-lysidine synthase